MPPRGLNSKPVTLSQTNHLLALDIDQSEGWPGDKKEKP